MKNSKALLLSIAVLLNTPTYTSPWRKAANIVADACSKHWRKAACITTGAVAAYPTVNTGYDLLKKLSKKEEILQQCGPVSQGVENWVRSKLEQHGYPWAKTITILTLPDYRGTAAICLDAALLLVERWQNDIEIFAEKEKYGTSLSSYEESNMGAIEGTMDHEMSHYKNKDCLRTAISYIIAPLSTEIAFLPIIKLALNKGPLTFAASLAAIMAAKYSLNSSIPILYQRRKEIEADNHALVKNYHNYTSLMGLYCFYYHLQISYIIAIIHTPSDFNTKNQSLINIIRHLMLKDRNTRNFLNETSTNLIASGNQEAIQKLHDLYGIYQADPYKKILLRALGFVMDSIHPSYISRQEKYANRAKELISERREVMQTIERYQDIIQIKNDQRVADSQQERAEFATQCIDKMNRCIAFLDKTDLSYKKDAIETALQNIEDAKELAGPDFKYIEPKIVKDPLQELELIK